MDIITEKLLERIDIPRIESESGSLLFFPQNYLVNKFIDLFEIRDKKIFEKAFDIVTLGKGQEIQKINSLKSSSLLSLLLFYRLFGNKENKKFIEFSDDNLKGIHFTDCLFEVRNKVIRFPSCIDILLISEDKKNLLFLESKFTEYNECVKKAEYGKGYWKLYDSLSEKNLITPLIFKRKITNKTVLESKDENYIEGIKQSISHLIGLVKGPTNENPRKGKQDVYISYEYEKYKNLFEEALNFYYGTIIYDPLNLGVSNFDFIKYRDLYKAIIGEKGREILQEVRDIFDNSNKKSITILKDPIIYNKLSSDFLQQVEVKIRNYYNI